MSTSSIKPALSDDWRTGPSLNQPIDMANALRSIQKVVAAVDTRGCNVSFNTQEELHFSSNGDDTLQIRIDPRFALRSKPIQGQDFDILTGLSVHEALHSSCESDKVRKGGTPTYGGIVRVGEEIYIDNFGKRNFPVLGKYIHLAREGYKPEEKLIPWDDIYTTWTAIAVYGIMPHGDWLTDSRKVAQLQLLMELSSRLMGEDMEPYQRQALYKETSDRLAKMMERQEIEDKINRNKAEEPPLELDAPKGLVEIKAEKEPKEESDSDGKADNAPGDREEDKKNSTEGEEEGGGSGEEEGYPDDKGDASVPQTDSGKGEVGEDETGTGQDATDTDPSNSSSLQGSDGQDHNDQEDSDAPLEPADLQSLLHPATTELSSEMANSIAEVLELGIEDMSEEVSKAFGVSGSEAIIWSKARTELDKEFNQQLARQLVWVKDYKNTTGHQTYRNEERGNLDAQRLYKAPINGLIFKKRVKVPKADLDLVMLLDASSSMSRNTSIYEDAKALHQTLPESIILSYADRDNVMLTEHTEGRAFHAVEPQGGTPTALAIAATALRFPTSLIIHFTDGECDVTELEELFPKIQKQFPKLRMVHVQLRQEKRYRSYTTDDGIPEFPNLSKTVMMDSVGDFPAKLKEILKEW